VVHLAALHNQTPREREAWMAPTFIYAPKCDKNLRLYYCVEIVDLTCLTCLAGEVVA